MSIFSDIVSKIFHHGTEASAAELPSALPPEQAASPAAAPLPTSVDVAKILDGLEKQSGEHLNWRQSIVDLMKLLGLDSSLAHRQELAGELQYKGNTSDSAAMNIWLHKEVMIKLSEHGGTVPDELRH